MDKRELRRKIQNIAKELPESYKKEASLSIQNKIIVSEAFASCNSIFIYVSTALEPETFLLLEKAWEMGKQVYVPKCYAGNTMKAVRVRSMADLAPGMLGILEPVDDSETVDSVDLAIVPCVSASKSGARLGHGGGYYDKFLEAKSMKKVCICFERLISDEIPMSELDTWMDAVVTEV